VDAPTAGSMEIATFTGEAMEETLCWCLVGVYVDDLVISGTKDTEVAAFKEEMKAIF
jgi:hypothetical protein